MKDAFLILRFRDSEFFVEKHFGWRNGKVESGKRKSDGRIKNEELFDPQYFWCKREKENSQDRFFFFVLLEYFFVFFGHWKKVEHKEKKRQRIFVRNREKLKKKRKRKNYCGLEKKRGARRSQALSYQFTKFTSLRWWILRYLVESELRRSFVGHRSCRRRG